VRALPVCKIKPLPRVQALSLGYRPLDCHGNAMKHRLRYRHRATVHGWQISWDPDNNRLAALRAIERLKSGDDCTEVMSAMWKPLVASTGCGS
jgi:hypothetical protein